MRRREQLGPAGPICVLVGPPGAGKSTIGELLAGKFGVALRDTDADVAAAAGKPIPDIFVEDGEATFRELERAAVSVALRDCQGVLALGGGAVLDPQTRQALHGHRVVYLSVGLAAAVSRVGLGQGRPLLALNPRATLRHLLDQRRPLYEAVATITVATDDRTEEEVAAEVAALLRAPAVRIDVAGERPYPVFVGRDLDCELPAQLAGASQVAVVFSAPLADRADRLIGRLGRWGYTPLPIEVPDAEAGKTSEVAARCWDLLGGARFTRNDAIIGVGGGAVTDLAGFVAATWLRGIRWVSVSTSLLGMVDAAVGGKTGINTPAGKNLVGAFHPPVGVLCDLANLGTLPKPELRSGLAEVVKHGFIADPVILDLIERDPAAALDPGSEVLAQLVERSIRVKARVVTEDLREAGLREILNYGHTFGHAVERSEGYTWRHGNAVAVGLVYAAALGRLTGRLDPATAARHARVLRLLGLPTGYRAGDFADLLATMRVDKKARGSVLRFVVLDGLARPAILADPDPALLLAAYREISAPAVDPAPTSEGKPTSEGNLP